MKRVRSVTLLLIIFLSATIASHAQSIVDDLPRPSQHAEVVQRIGVTDITINYSRPLVNGRKVFGGLEAYGKVWRAGANENTTITFTDPVTIEGKPLDRGTYGLHMIPGENEWTVIFSKANSSWGSFTYNQAEDALRVTVKPQTSELHEALTYEFDDLKPDSAVVTLRWDKIAVPFKVSVNVNEVVEQKMRDHLRGLAQYTWDGWNDAADYLVNAKVDLEEALTYTDKSIAVEERYENLMTKSQVLDLLGRKEEAAKFRTEALARSNASQSYTYARQLQRDKKLDEAWAAYRANAKKFPNDWITHFGLARMYSAQGDYDNALKEAKIALAGAPADGSKDFVEGQIRRLEAKQDINT
jgi:tetratricopeptide (TPR) repeat protein